MVSAVSSHDKYYDDDDDIYYDDDGDYYDVDVDGDDNDDDEYDDVDDNAYAASVAAADNDDEIVLLYCYVQTSKTSWVLLIEVSFDWSYKMNFS